MGLFAGKVPPKNILFARRVRHLYWDKGSIDSRLHESNGLIDSLGSVGLWDQLYHLVQCFNLISIGSRFQFVQIINWFHGFNDG